VAKDAPFEAGLLTHGLHTDLLSAPSHPVGQWLFRRGFRCRSQLRGQWRLCTALPAHPWRIVVFQRPKLLWEHEADSNPLRSNNPDFNRSIQLRSGKDGMGSGGEFDQQKYETPSISLWRRSRASLRFHCSRNQVFGLPWRSLILISALDATRPFPERKWSLPSNSRQGFLTSGSNAKASRPSQSPTWDQWPWLMEASHCRYTVAGTVRALHPLPLSPSLGTC